MNPIVSLDYYDEEYINKSKGMIAWFIYSDTDTAFAKYIRESWNALDRFCKCRIGITINKPGHTVKVMLNFCRN